MLAWCMCIRLWVDGHTELLSRLPLRLACQLETIVSDDFFWRVFDKWRCWIFMHSLCYRHSDEWCFGFWCSCVSPCLIEQLAIGKLQSAHLALAVYSSFILSNLMHTPDWTTKSTLRAFLRVLQMRIRIQLDWIIGNGSHSTGREIQNIIPTKSLHL